MKKNNIVLGLLFAVFILIGSVFAFGAQNASADWVQQTTNIRNWKSVASSADGTKLAAVVKGGYIYTSNDSGITWTVRTNVIRDWQSITSSADGTKLAAVVYNGYIYTSTDSGVNWAARTVSPGYWESIASSADGTKLVACLPYTVFTSIDSGIIWNAQYGGYNFKSVTSSADGTKLVLAEYEDLIFHQGFIYTSNDMGNIWVKRDGSRNWYSVASSSDGTKLSAIGKSAGNGYIYTSTDSGATWTKQNNPGSNYFWQSIAMSSDGTKLTAVVDGGYVYISIDSGVTWTKQTSAGYHPWSAVASSSDGNKLVALTSPGFIYTYTNSPSASSVPTLTTQGATVITQITASLAGNITATGGTLATIRGFNYGTTTAYGQTVNDSGSYSTGVFTKVITGLTCGTTYHYRSYATNTSGTGYGSDMTFTTSNCPNYGTAPVNTTQPATLVSKTFATLNGNLTSTNGTVTTRGFNYGITTNYGTTTTETGSFGVGAYTKSLSTLTCGTTYHYRSYAVNTTGTGYGSDQTFFTTACASGVPTGTPTGGGTGSGTGITIPTLTTQLATLTTTSAALNGNITSTGGANATVRGFSYGTTTAYGNTTTETGSFIAGAFTKNILSKTVISLPCGITYHYRSYATNNIGTGYGNDQVFSSGECTGVSTAPTIGAQRASVITETSATLNSSIMSTGGADVTGRGFEYGMDTRYGRKTSESGTFTTGAFSAKLLSLTCSTTYHYRSYATSSAGIGYGSDQEFSTSICLKTPVITPNPDPIKTSLLDPDLTGNALNAFDSIKNINEVVTPKKEIEKTLFTSNRNLSLGKTGDDVKALQIYLNSHGYIVSVNGEGSVGNETTKFGKKTKDAVILFQKANGLDTDGTVGALTLGKMK